MKGRARVGISRIALIAALIVVVGVAGIAFYVTSNPSGSSSTTRTLTSSTVSAAPLDVSMVPPSPLIAPGQTQNYSLIEVQATGSGLTGTLSVRAFAPAGLAATLNQTSVPESDAPQVIPVALTASPNILPGKYQVTVEVGSSTMPAENETFTIQVVPELVTMKDEAFHPQNITVTKGTQVTWLNLDSMLGCCDPGNHDVSFLSGANETSPILARFQTWTYTFGSDGMVEYYCTIHPFMKGQVAVTG